MDRVCGRSHEIERNHHSASMSTLSLGQSSCVSELDDYIRHFDASTLHSESRIESDSPSPASRLSHKRQHRKQHKRPDCSLGRKEAGRRIYNQKEFFGSESSDDEEESLRPRPACTIRAHRNEERRRRARTLSPSGRDRIGAGGSLGRNIADPSLKHIDEVPRHHRAHPSSSTHSNP